MQEIMSGLRIKDPFLFKAGERIGRQHFSPFIAVIASRITPAKDVREAVLEAVKCRRHDNRDLLTHFIEDLLDPAVMAAEAEAATPTDAAPEANPETTPDAGDTATADAEAAATPEPFVPVDLNINQFALSALGAKITANGQLTGPEGGEEGFLRGEDTGRRLNGLVFEGDGR